MTATQYLGATSSAPIWWSDSGKYGMRGYIGGGDTGIQYSRHDDLSDLPGKWSVAITGWRGAHHAAVVDDFGSLVEVKS
jgi:hypothetical protein